MTSPQEQEEPQRESESDRTATPAARSPRTFGRHAMAYGAYLLFPVVLFGFVLAAQLVRAPGAGWLGVVAGSAGVAIAVFLPTRGRRRNTNQQFLERVDPSERARWERVLRANRWIKVACVLVLPAVGLLAMLVYVLARLPWRDPTLAEGISVVILAVPVFGALTWAMQWLVLGFGALRDRG